MKPENRRQNILSRLRAMPQEWRVDELARVLKVSPLTIRRDLDALAHAGSIVRTLGGCMAVSRLTSPVYQKRVATHFELKQAIGRAAVKEIKSGDVLIINDGSTCFHLATCLGACGPITVYTNSIAMITEFNRYPNVRLYVLGGRYDPDLFFLGGSLMERVLETVQADLVFLGTDAIDRQGRCLVLDQDTAGTTQAMLRQGRRKILLADGTKVGAKGRVVYGTLNDFDLWITTAGIEPALLNRFRKLTKIKEVACG